MDDEPKNLDLRPAETHKEFYVAVRYYGADLPYVSVYAERDQVGDAEKVYKIKIPYGVKKDEETKD